MPAGGGVHVKLPQKCFHLFEDHAQLRERSFAVCRVSALSQECQTLPPVSQARPEYEQHGADQHNIQVQHAPAHITESLYDIYSNILYIIIQ